MTSEPDKDIDSEANSPENTELETSIVENESEEKDSGVATDKSGSVTPISEKNSNCDDDDVIEEDDTDKNVFENSSDSDDYDDEKEKEDFEEQMNEQLDKLALTTLQQAIPNYFQK